VIDGRDHRQRSADLEAEVQALRAEVRRLRKLLEIFDGRPAWLWSNPSYRNGGWDESIQDHVSR
jgi:hypothetical protein